MIFNKKLITSIFSILIILTFIFSTSVTVFAGDGAGNAGGNVGVKGTNQGVSYTGIKRNTMYVWFDKGGWDDSDQAGANKIPAQGYFDSNTGKWYNDKGKVSGKTTSNHFFTYDFFIEKMSNKVAKKYGKSYKKYDYISRGWNSGTRDTFLKKKMEEACKEAIKRAKTRNSKVHTARVVGVAVTYAKCSNVSIPSHNYNSGKFWYLTYDTYHDKSFVGLFGGKENGPYAKNKKNSAIFKGLKDKYGWGDTVNPSNINSAKKETWRTYTYRLAYNSFKNDKPRIGKKADQYYVLAVADDEPGGGPSFKTNMVNLLNNGSEKWDAREPGNVKVKDEILYKNVNKNYKVSADLVLSDEVDLGETPDFDEEEEEEEITTPDDDEGEDEEGETPEYMESEDGVIRIQDKTVYINEESELYENNYSNGKLYAVVTKKNSENDWTNVISVQELEESITELDIPQNEEEVWIGVYYKEDGTDVNITEDTALVGTVYVIPEETPEEPDDEPYTPEEPEEPVAEGTILASVSKVDPSPAFKHGSGQTAWQRGSFITLQGKSNGYLDLYKSGLYNSVGDFNKTYKLGIRAEIFDGNESVYKHNYALDDGAEAMQTTGSPFGTLTFDKQAVYNFKNASVVETGAKFQVYNKEFQSYEDAVADATNKGYETYKYDMITITADKQTHGSFQDNIKWELHNGMLVPGTYVIKEISAGDFSQSNRLVDPFEMTVEKQKIKTLSNKVDNPHYTYDLTVEKRSTNPWRSEWEPFDEDPLYSKLTRFKLESLDDEQNVMGNGNGNSPTATNKNGSYLSTIGYSKTDTTNPWTISISNLPSGKYRITEDAPIGYWLPEEKAAVDFVVHRDMTGQVEIDSLKTHDAGFTKADVRKTETADKTSYAVTFTRSNVPQGSGTIKLHKDRESENAVGNREKEGFPFVEFNLYADADNPLTPEENDGGDIRAYDGHKDHVYYTAGQLIRGITIDEETGERKYFNDGKEVSEETYRIMTDPDGNWDSSKVYKNEKLVADEDAFEHYPLTNNNLIDTYNKDGTPTGERDGVSFYRLQEMYIWQYGDHISFSDVQKEALMDAWTTSYTKEGTAYGTQNEKIPNIGLSMNQILNHGIDITENDSNNGDQSGRKTYTYSSFGKELTDDVVLSFLRDKILQYVDPANGVDDTIIPIINKHEKEVGTIEYKLLVLLPDQENRFPNIPDTYSEFQILPDNIDITQYIEVPLQQFNNSDLPQLKTVARTNENGSKIYTIYDNSVTIHDTVSYFNLNPNREYTMVGTLYNYYIDEEGNTTLGEPILDKDGQIYKVSETFIPKDQKGKVEMVFKCDPEQLNYANVVVFEQCYLGNDLIAQEWDPNIESQQIICEPFPIHIETEATHGEKHIMPNDSSIKFTDKVTCTGLKEGITYTLKGTLMDKETGEVVKVDGKEVVSEYSFEAKGIDPEIVEIPFDVTTNDLDGKTVVVFEEIFKGNETANKKPLSEHKDINDEAQSIVIPAVKTIASDENTKINVGERSKTQKVVDEVKYENLIVGDKYIVSGKLMRKSDMSVLAEATSEPFIAEQANGTVMLTFEVNSEDLAGDSAVAFETLYDHETNAIVGVHEDINDPDQTINYPEIKTNAVDEATKLHVGELNEKSKIVDRVTYKNLIPNVEYSLTGTLMNKETGEPLEIDGKTISVTESFTPDNAEGSYDLHFEVDSTKISGLSVVAFEELTYKNILVAEHKDINDPDQTVHYPKISTKADLTSDNIIVDKVSYTNIIPNKKYVLEGKLMDKETGEEIEGSKKQKEFTPSSTDGTEDLIFEVDLSKVAGRSVVAFEKLYILDENNNKHEVARHEDIDDPDQTVDIPLVELNVTVAKADAEKVNYFLKGAEITIYDKDDNVAKDKDGKECVGITDENGEVKFAVLYSEGESYYAQETKAPKGYQINKEKFEVEANIYDKHSVEVPISILDEAIIIPPAPPIDTGDITSLLLYIFAILTGLFILIMHRRLKK